MRRITNEELQGYLNEIISCDAFELHAQKKECGRCDYYIPYMMNDALECFLLLQNGRMTGNYVQDIKEEMHVELVTEKGDSALIFRQGTTNVFTVWFEEVFQELKCFRYDRIGHFWIEGQEHWRRLVYMIGTMHDKYNYMGDHVCNAEELALLPLMEFAPFRYFSPIHDSLDEYYKNSQSGVDCMRNLAFEAGDRTMMRMLGWYRLKILKGILDRRIIRMMMRPGRNALYQLLFKKVETAAGQYPERSYSETMDAKIQQMRDRAELVLRERGFSGVYPLFQKGTLQILAMEEHPFTIMEYDHYDFKIQYMVSEVPKRKKKHAQLLNAGFFKRKGNRSWIARDVEGIEKRVSC